MEWNCLKIQWLIVDNTDEKGVIIADLIFDNLVTTMITCIISI